MTEAHLDRLDVYASLDQRSCVRMSEIVKAAADTNLSADP
jgi:hypothetical protein